MFLLFYLNWKKMSSIPNTMNCDSNNCRYLMLIFKFLIDYKKRWGLVFTSPAITFLAHVVQFAFMCKPYVQLKLIRLTILFITWPNPVHKSYLSPRPVHINHHLLHFNCQHYMHDNRFKSDYYSYQVNLSSFHL